MDVRSQNSFSDMYASSILLKTPSGNILIICSGENENIFKHCHEWGNAFLLSYLRRLIDKKFETDSKRSVSVLPFQLCGWGLIYKYVWILKYI